MNDDTRRVWKLFQIAYSIGFGVFVADYISTLVAVSRDPRYEQNPAVLWMLPYIHWTGIGVLVAFLYLVGYRATRVVAEHNRIRVLRLYYSAIVVMLYFRVIVVFSAVGGLTGWQLPR